MYSRLVFLNMHRADGKTDKEIVAHASHGFDTAYTRPENYRLNLNNTLYFA